MKSEIDILSREIGKIVGVLEANGFVHAYIVESIEAIMKRCQKTLNLEEVVEGIAESFCELHYQPAPNEIQEIIKEYIKRA